MDRTTPNAGLSRRRFGLAAAAATGAMGLGWRPARAATGADVAKAKAEGKVMLYTSLDTKIVDAIIKPFTAQYGIKVEYYRGGSADVTSKVLAEADAGQIRADIVDASDIGAFLAMKQRKLLRPYDSPSTRTVAANLKDPDGMWCADRLTQAVINWNTRTVGKVPQHWEDLADPRFMGKLAYFSSSNGDGAPRLYTLATAFGWKLLERYAALKPLRLNSPQVMTQIIESGERSAGFLINDNIAWRSKRQGKPTDYCFPTEGVPTELGAVGLPKDAPHPNAGALFYDWWMGEAGQKLLADGGKYSSRADLAPPEGNPPLAKLKLIIPDNQKLFTQRSAIHDKLAGIFGGEWGG